MLNDYSKVELNANTTFRYITNGQSLEEIDASIKGFKSDNYYKKLIQNEFWKNSYECNLYEGKE